MADEITVQVALQRTDSTNTVNSHYYPSSRILVDQTLKRHNDLFQNIGTSEESPTFTDITTNGYLLMQNLDPTNYVEWGVTTAVYAGKMLAGETAGPFRLSAGATLFLKANTAACDVRIILYGA